ncbi:MAG: hypothetical protein K2J49_07930, partial [Muribaculaceae bacterium]|nr:hypothetical protein [Muribaculaceae bacterium]
MVRSNLLQCGVDTADVFVAGTPDETVNIISCEPKTAGRGNVWRGLILQNSRQDEIARCSCVTASTRLSIRRSWRPSRWRDS